MTKVPNEIGGRRTQLVVVGDGPDRATIEHQCQSLGLNERVTLRLGGRPVTVLRQC